MKKMILTIFLCAGIFFVLTGCNNFNKDIHTFKGIITKCEQKTMLVEPNKGEKEFKSSDSFRVEYVNGFDTCNINDKVQVTYEGEINESYPAQINTINIKVIK